MTVAVVCEHCGDPLPPPSSKGGPRRKYCPDTVKNCRTLAFQKRKRAEKNAANPPKFERSLNQTRIDRTESKDGRASARRPPDEFIDDMKLWLDRLDGKNGQRKWSQPEVAEYFEVEQGTVSRWVAWCRERAEVRMQRADWEAPTALLDHVRALKPLWDGETDPTAHPDQLPLLETDPYWSAIEELVERFKQWRAKYMVVPETGLPYDTPPHQRRWFRQMFHTYIQGTRAAIIATPRHGKTEGFRDFDCFIICEVNPNVRIIHIGGNEDIAGDFVQSVLDVLENNERLIADYCGPGMGFKPETKTGKTWSRKKFTVATRTVTGMKSPTMIAVGRDGRLPSRDADIVQFDDIEDTGSTAMPASRALTRRWFVVDLSSRKEPHTAMFGIGQRVHTEDLLGHLKANSEWTVIADVAHNEDVCEIVDDPDDTSHWDEHQTCMLWPEKNNYAWLMSCLNNSLMEDGTRATFDMVYLGKVNGDDTTLFRREDIEACFNRDRRIGDRTAIPGRCRLIAGLDPARSGYQAAVLWAVDVEAHKWYLLDLENEQAGGLEHLRSILSRWHEQYGLVEWVYEVNGAQREWIKDRDVIELRRRLGIQIKEHTTSSANKSQNTYDVSKLAPLFKQRVIDLPFGCELSKQKVTMFSTQLRNFSLTATGRQTTWKTDLVMAAWFPLEPIMRWQMEHLGQSSTPYMRDGTGAFDTVYTADAFKIDYSGVAA